MKIPTKLKYLEIKPIYVVLAVVVAVIIRFWGENTITMLQKEVPEITTTEMSAAEIYHYIKTKQAFIANDMHIDWVYAMRSNFDDVIDKKTHEWFLVNKWRPSRFVYVQYRIKDILKYIHNREFKLGEAQRMEKQAKEFELILQQNPDDSKAGQYAAELHKQADDIIYYKDREIRHAGITLEEEDIVLKNRYILEEIIDK